uniref:Carrier domain-containing protein n=1 Tax=Haptolina ericina TaxID=156174 RepID=A0A7S3B1N0_9EUKA
MQPWGSAAILTQTSSPNHMDPMSAQVKFQDEEATRVVLEVLSEKTGFDAEMLELDMSISGELGLDSFKRHELLTEIQERIGVEVQDVTVLAQTQTIGEVVGVLVKEVGGIQGAMASHGSWNDVRRAAGHES